MTQSARAYNAEITICNRAVAPWLDVHFSFSKGMTAPLSSVPSFYDGTNEGEREAAWSFTAIKAENPLDAHGKALTRFAQEVTSGSDLLRAGGRLYVWVNEVRDR